ncbi:hypothetical protein K431DRAFT_289696 [Polychaeton citri CBS 116435]|uniref:C2H2-type domain-containing protein n=1 Tax=Polychaeton citri CBS 116435 TaxID=1314669 RepID=A0A9P4Q0G8_9PEZI|nr:hypothetical protein K431DRAFT_289696 [Polychaeton citri CBS 116435]
MNHHQDGLGNATAATAGAATPEMQQAGRKRQERDETADAVDADAPAGGAASARKIQKTDKTFKCDFEGCGKAYSRAEHLQRHQLNHAPKEIFHCQVPGCNREFVRQDLYLRHRERHFSHGGAGGSGSGPVGAASQSPSEQPHNLTPGEGVGGPVAGAGSVAPGSRPKRRVGRPSLADMHHASEVSDSHQQQHHQQQQAAQQQQQQQILDTSTNTPTSTTGNQSSPGATGHRNGVSSGIPSMNNETGTSYFDGSQIEQQQNVASAAPPPMTSHHVHFASQDLRPNAQARSSSYGGYSNRQSIDSGQIGSAPRTPYLGPNQTNFTVSSAPSFPSHLRSDSFQLAQQTAQDPYTPRSYAAPQVSTSVGVAAANMQISQSLAMGNMQDQTVSDSPHSSREDFTSWLFDDALNMYGGYGQQGFQPGGDSVDPHFLETTNAIGQSYDPLLNSTYMDMSQDMMNWAGQAASSPAVSVSDLIISHFRRMELIDIMRTQFNQALGSTTGPDKEALLRGDPEADDHVLSSRSVQAYIHTYWQHFHEQLPILHRPTFSADNSPTLLVLAVIAIGASLLPEKTYGTEMTNAAQNLANFIAWHLRWQVFMDSSFQPPAKLWVLQTLVLLETYEKMNATRALHERANIHYATTIHLMRRGTALVEDLRAREAGQSRLSPHEYWERWVTAEATRRVAFAAFVLDSLHASMFGHTAVMRVHEIQLPLPCDEALWSATSPAEVGRIEASFHLNGIRPLTFVQALKKTMTGKKVRTNPFGRMVLMSGLMSVSWHLRQRDLQVTALGVSQANALPESWRSTLSRAFDAWKRDFDDDMLYLRAAPFAFGLHASGAHVEPRYSADMASVLHHLSHVSMHVNIIDCQILAGAPKLLGRAITQTDRQRVHKKLSIWAKSANASKAITHALHLLRQYLQSDPSVPGGRINYSARDDSLLVRPWSLYFAALSVWTYHYVRTHETTRQSPPLSRAVSPSDYDQSRAATPAPEGITAPGNKQIGLLPQASDFIDVDRSDLLATFDQLATGFRGSRWEILREAANRLVEARGILLQENGG